MTDVFISYKHRMMPRVAEIAAALRELGLDVWYDAGLVSGSDYADAISKHLRAAKCVLVCWTNDAFPHGGDKNGWVRGEAEKGRDRDVLVAVMLEETDLDPPWNMVHYERLIDWTPASTDRAVWQRVLNAIGALVGRPGLGEYDRASRAASSAELSDWARSHGDDPLAAGARIRAKELYLAEAAARFEAEEAGQAEDVARKAKEAADAERRRADQQAASARLAREAAERAERDARDEAEDTKRASADRIPQGQQARGIRNAIEPVLSVQRTHSVSAMDILVAGGLGLVACAILIFSAAASGAMEDQAPGITFAIVGTSLYGLPLAWLFWRRKLMRAWQAIILAVAMPVIALGSAVAASSVGYSSALFGAAGLAGAIASFAVLAALRGIPLMGRSLAIAAATSAVCGVAIAGLVAVLGSGFGPGSLGALTLTWQIPFTVGLAALFLAQPARSARSI
ncbi:MAG TPA: toll/interleukin-1 receptor domain-containing protein [Devosia sp.]|nr:toll/interleukin-1 receptor domain-containing protein [Devosia sp.]